MDARKVRWHAGGVALAGAGLISCGARTPPTIDDAEGDGTGGSASTSAATASTGPGGSGGGLDCVLTDLATWKPERYRDFGDYERAAVATSGVPWVALKVREGNIVIERLGIEDDVGITVLEAFELPDSPVYPVALDVSDERFVVLTTTGINWNGDVELWSVDRHSGSVLRAPIGEPPADPAYTVGSALGLVGADVVVAYSRLIDDEGVVELRDAQLQVIESRAVSSVSFQAVRGFDEALDVYLGAVSRLRFQGRTITEEAVDPTWHILGGLEDYLVQYGDEIRLAHDDQIWSGPWPHTQISPPAVVRKGADGRVAFTLETELTSVVGHPGATGLEWMPIEAAPGASGIGVGLLPVLQEGRLGQLYLGLEIPMPEQPLRYFGRVCR